MSAAPATKIDIRQLALAAYEVKREITQRDRRDRSRRLLWERLESDRFGLWGINRYDLDEVGFLEDDRAYIDIDGLRLAGPLEACNAGLFLIHDDQEFQVVDIADIGLIIATEILSTENL